MMEMMPQYNTMLFTEVWDSANKFKQDVLDYGLNKIKEENLIVVHKLLYAKYGNNPIANSDVNQFKAKVCMILFQYGPTWERRVEIQDIVRQLSEDEIRTGTKTIINEANNPDTDPTTSQLEEVAFISRQNTSNYKKSKLEGYSMLLDLLKTDVTGEFINKFQKCFKAFVSPENPLLYVTKEED